MRLRRLVIVALAAAAVCVPAVAAPNPKPTVWVNTLPANEAFDRLAAFPDGTVYDQYGAGYAKSTDFGATWSMFKGPDEESGSVGFLRWTTPRDGFALVGRATPAVLDPVTRHRCPIGVPWFDLDVTLDGGGRGQPACTPVAPAAEIVRTNPDFVPKGVAVSRRGDVLVAGDVGNATCQDTSDIHPVLFTTSDTGGHWRTVTLPGAYSLDMVGLGIRDMRHVVVIAGRVDGSCRAFESDPMYVFATSDGVHYKRVFRCPGTRYCTTAAWVTPTRLIVGLNDGQLYVSNNRGHSFFKGALLRDSTYDPLIDSGQFDPRVLWAQALSFSDALHGFASTRGSGTWRTTDGGIRWVQENSPECVYYPFGVGDIAAADAQHGVTGGPRSLDIRQPGKVEIGCLGAQSGGPQLAGSARYVATMSQPGDRGVSHLDRYGRPGLG